MSISAADHLKWPGVYWCDTASIQWTDKPACICVWLYHVWNVCFRLCVSFPKETHTCNRSQTERDLVASLPRAHINKTVYDKCLAFSYKYKRRRPSGQILRARDLPIKGECVYIYPPSVRVRVECIYVCDVIFVRHTSRRCLGACACVQKWAILRQKPRPCFYMASGHGCVVPI